LLGEFVPDMFVPKEGMRFDDLDDAYEFYCDYAKLVGFDVMKIWKRTQVSWYVCNKEGFSRKANVLINKHKRVQCELGVKLK
jgi:hypothetical protein